MPANLANPGCWSALAAALILASAGTCLADANGGDSAASPSPAAPAASTNETVHRLEVDLSDGSRIVGTSPDESFRFHSPLLGDLTVALAAIRSIEFSGTSGTAQLTATNGDRISVQFIGPVLRADTSFGKAKLPLEFIRSVKVWTMTGPGQLPSGLVDLWSGEGNGNDSAGGNNGALSGNATYAEGKVGKAFYFDGVNSFVKIPQSPRLNFTDQLTISFWMKADADNPMRKNEGLVSSDFYCVEINGEPTGTNWGVNFSVSTTADPPIGDDGISTGANHTQLSLANGAPATVTADQWHHIAATYDGANLRLYVDGRPWGNPKPHTGAIRPMLPASSMAIGGEDGRTTITDCGIRYFKGLIDEVAIYNRALSGDEIEAICRKQNNGELPRPAPGTTQGNGIPGQDGNDTGDGQ